ncbi:hypothetical protein SAMN05892877_103392 [Rhizobium subbaraonis]|uniref:Uncharacterized protein n=1 Tax=Rhizobium subbaraonis TaxID=908946 RepID=A0A285U6M7_9HYPH|nr:hypothetical protein [Rhizobium subbaraonis]SOC37048.1 hypothetical protein SAMN05892877_103392 [Rhizobium subbaraonis]
MKTERNTFERLLTEWRDAQARVDALKIFEENGGSHRLRVIADDENHHIQAGIVSDLMHGTGYRVLLTTAIKEATLRAEKARQRFLNEAASEAVGLSLADNGKAA